MTLSIVERRIGPALAAAGMSTPLRVDVAPYAMVRLSSLPYPQPARAARRLRRLLDALVERERVLAALAEPLSHSLYLSRSSHTLDYHRSVVLPLRRDVHNRRSPAPALRAVLGDLPDRVPGLATWLATVDERTRLLAEAACATDVALAADREALASICADERLRQAVALSSTSLLSGLERAAALGAEPDARARKAEPKILRYALRATAKTSPWSWFTVVGWGQWAAEEAGPDRIHSTALSLPNHALVSSFLRGLLAMPEHRRGIAYRLAPALTVSDGHVEFQRDEVVGTVSYTLTQEQLVRLRRTAALDFTLAEVRRAGSAGRTLDQLAGVLAGRLRAGESTSAAAAGYVERLVDEGLLVPIAPLDPQTADPLPALADWLAACGHNELASILRRIGCDTRRFAGLAAAQRPDVLRGIAEDWRRAFAATGIEKPDVAALREDVVFRDPMNLGSWAGRDNRTDLARVAPLTALFDNANVLRALLRQRLLERYGRGGSCRVAELMADSAQLWTASARIKTDGTLVDGLGDEAPLPDELVDLAALRRQVTAAARSSPRRHDHVEFADELVDEVAARLPEWLLRRPSSHSYFVQPFRDGERTGWCVNSIGDGWGRYTSRFLDALGPKLAEAVAEQVRGTLSGGRIAQYRPLYGFNANLHPRLVADEVGEDPAWVTLLADELELVHDPNSDSVRLRVAATGEYLDVLYLGFLLQPALPDRVAPLYLDLGGSRPRLGHLALAEPVEVAGYVIERHHRLRYRSLVLARRSWKLDPNTVAELIADLRRDGEVPFAAMARWAAALGLPLDVFISGQGFTFGDPDALRAYFTDPKPQYVDLGSALHLRCLARLLSEHTGPVRITEAMPVPGDAPTGRHAFELVVETYHRRG